jgi:hypothetical protein
MTLWLRDHKSWRWRAGDKMPLALKQQGAGRSQLLVKRAPVR